MFIYQSHIFWDFGLFWIQSASLIFALSACLFYLFFYFLSLKFLIFDFFDPCFLGYAG